MQTTPWYFDTLLDSHARFAEPATEMNILDQ